MWFSPQASLGLLMDSSPRHLKHVLVVCPLHQVELCRLFNLMDLNQTEPWVRRTLLNWIADITHEYGFDGYRIDTAVEVG